LCSANRSSNKLWFMNRTESNWMPNVSHFGKSFYKLIKTKKTTTHSEIRWIAKVNLILHSKMMVRFIKRKLWSRVSLNLLLWTSKDHSIVSDTSWSQIFLIIYLRRMPFSTLKSSTAKAWISWRDSFSWFSEMRSWALRHLWELQKFSIWAIFTRRNFPNSSYSSTLWIGWCLYSSRCFISISKTNKLQLEFLHLLGL